MESSSFRVSRILSLLLISAVCDAEQYDYEVNLGFGRTTFDGSQLITRPNGTIFESRDSETDEYSAIGKWYFAGLSDDLGPRARAEFVDRASSISVSYLHTDQTSSFFRRNDDPSFPLLPPVESFNFGADGDSFAAGIRYVDRDSGWFGSARLFTSSLSSDGVNSLVFGGSDVDAWTLGVGKYLYETTALSLELGQVDGPGEADSSLVAATFTHLGGIGERWQYAIDLGYARSDAEIGPDLDTWGAALALYPTRDVEFGVSVEDVSADGSFAFDADATTVTGFASWFVKPNLQLSARYSVDDVNFFPSVFLSDSTTETDADQDSFGIDVLVRF